MREKKDRKIYKYGVCQMFYQFDENLDKEIHFDAEFDLERQRQLAEEFEEMETNHDSSDSYDQYCAMMRSTFT